MKSQTVSQLHSGGWGAGIGAIIAMLIGFSWGGWVTATTAEDMASEAVLATRAEFCVAQFMSAQDHQAQLTAFMETDSWKRREFVEKGGWDKLPGQAEATTYVSINCANAIEALAEAK